MKNNTGIHRTQWNGWKEEQNEGGKREESDRISNLGLGLKHVGKTIDKKTILLVGNGSCFVSAKAENVLEIKIGGKHKEKAGNRKSTVLYKRGCSSRRKGNMCYSRDDVY